MSGVALLAGEPETKARLRASGSPIIVRTCYLFDRDGYFIELNKVLDRENYNKN